VTLRAREIYQSENGDRWYLAHDLGSGRVFVRHQPNLPPAASPATLSWASFSQGALPARSIKS
jgi:hypothetical protein